MDHARDQEAGLPIGELKDAAFSGVRWVTFARLTGEVLALGGAVALARLIPPAEFGRAAVALAFTPLAVILTFEGCASALVQRRSMTANHVHGAVILSLVAGLGLTILGFTVGATIATAVFGSRTGELIELISPVFVLASIGAVPRALLWRDLNFRRVSVIEVLGLLVGAATAVGLAVGGLDGEALVAGALANAAASSALLFLSSPFSLRRSDRRSLRDITAFGFPAALAGLVHVGFTNANYLIIATRSDRGSSRSVLARVPARRRLPGEGQRDHDADRVSDLLAHPGP